MESMQCKVETCLHPHCADGRWGTLLLQHRHLQASPNPLCVGYLQLKAHPRRGRQEPRHSLGCACRHERESSQRSQQRELPVLLCWMPGDREVWDTDPVVVLFCMRKQSNNNMEGGLEADLLQVSVFKRSLILFSLLDCTS